MSETKRVLLSKLTVLSFLFVVAANTFIFINDGLMNRNDFYANSLSSYREMSLDEAYLRANEQLDDLENPMAEITATIPDFELWDNSVERNEADGFFDVEMTLDQYAAAKDVVEYILYLKSFPDYVEEVLSKGEQHGKFRFLSEADTFANRNIEKTISDFSTLNTVTPSIFSSYAVDIFIQYDLNDYLLVVLLLILCISFVKERKNGLWGIVRCTWKGRFSLAVQRIFILVNTSILFVLALYGLPLLLAFGYCGGWADIDMPAQSVRVFKMLTLNISIKDALLLYFGIKLLTTIILGLFLASILLLVNDHKISLLIIVLVFALQFALYSYLPIQSYLSLIKHFNLFSYMHTASLFTEYINISLFYYPVGLRDLIIFSFPVISSLLIIIIVLVHQYKMPNPKSSFMDKIIFTLGIILDKIISNLGCLGYEIYKIMILQRGLAIFLLVFIAALRVPFSTSIYREYEEIKQDELLSSLSGPITDDVYQTLFDYRQKTEKVVNDNADAEHRYAENEITYQEYFVMIQKAADASREVDIIDNTINYIEKVEGILTAKGIEPWILSDYPYRASLGYRIGETLNYEAANRHDYKAIICLFGLSLIICGGLPFDFQSGMSETTAITVNGRNKLLKQKNLVILYLAILTWFCAYCSEMYNFFFSGMFTTLSFPVQSLSMFSQFPFQIPVGTFFAIFYIYRCLMLICVAFIINGIASIFNSVQMAQVFTFLVVVLPSILYCIFDIGALEFVALARPISALNYLVSQDGMVTNILFPSFSMIFLMLMSVRFQRKWYLSTKFNFTTQS